MSSGHNQPQIRGKENKNKNLVKCIWCKSKKDKGGKNVKKIKNTVE